MRKFVSLVIVALLISGCAWSRSRSRTYDEDSGAITADRHSWSVVLGTGKLGAKATKTTATANTEDTGFSDQAAPAFMSVGSMIGQAIRVGSGLPPVPIMPVDMNEEPDE